MLSTDDVLAEDLVLLRALRLLEAINDEFVEFESTRSRGSTSKVKGPVITVCGVT